STGPPRSTPTARIRPTSRWTTPGGTIPGMTAGTTPRSPGTVRRPPPSGGGRFVGSGAGLSGQLFEPVPHAADGHEPLRPQLAPQIPHVDVDHIGARVEVITPHPAEQLFARQHLAGVAHERLRQRELPRGQVHGLVPHLRAPGA